MRSDHDSRTDSGAENVASCPSQRTLFDLYRLHAELAERVASLREGVNKLHSGIVASIVAASALLHRVDSDLEIELILPILAIVVCLSWIASLHSVTGRLAAKSAVLKDLEKTLNFDFLQREEKKFNEVCILSRKRSGFLIPGIFIVLCFVWIFFLVCRAGG